MRRRVAFALATSDRVEAAALRIPAVRERAYRAARRYVAGTTREDAFALARRLAADGLGASIDLFGENARSPQEAEEAAAEFRALAQALPPDAWLSVDLSHLGLDLDRDRCAAHLRSICERLPPGARAQVGAEEAARADAIHDIVLRCAPVECTVQANLRRSPQDIRRLVDGGVSVRLVKGAYVEPDALPWGPPTDEAFLALAALLDELGADYALATHDDAMRAPAPRYEQLLGVRPEAARRLAAEGRAVRLYVPYGSRWFRYWARRRAEALGA